MLTADDMLRAWVKSAPTGYCNTLVLAFVLTKDINYQKATFILQIIFSLCFISLVATSLNMLVARHAIQTI